MLLACEDDLKTLEGFVYSKRPSRDAIDTLVASCLRSPDEVALYLYELTIAHDIKKEVIQTILVWLELGGYIQSKGWRYGSYQATLLRPFDQILAGHSPERQEFLERFFEAGKKGQKYKERVTFELSAVAEELGENEKKLSQSLNWLESHGDVSLKPSQFLVLYQATEKGLSMNRKEISDQIEEHFTQWEEAELGRLGGIISLVEQEGCLEERLLDYFGEESKPCGECSKCKNEVLGEFRQPNTNQKEVPLEIIHEMLAEKHAALRSARQMTRFLCGMTSPATTRARLTTKHDSFGALSEFSFEEVLLSCETVMGKTNSYV